MSANILLYLWIVSIASDVGGSKVPTDGQRIVTDDICPDAHELYPCTCTVGDIVINIDCSNVTSEKQLADIFSRNFTGTDARKLIIKDNKAISTLQKGMFGTNQFIEVEITGNSIEKVEIGAFQASYMRLEKMGFSNNMINDFPFAEVAAFQKLTHLDVSSNVLLQFPDVVSSTLQDFFIGNNMLTEIPATAFSGMGNIARFRAQMNTISEIKKGTFDPLEFLREVDLTTNKLSEISNGTFIFKVNPTRTSLYLSFNNISLVEEDAIQGVIAELDIDSNSLETFEEEVWAPILEKGTRMSINDNPLECGCDIRWLIINDQYLSQLYNGATCTDGYLIKVLDPSFFDYCVTASPTTLED